MKIRTNISIEESLKKNAVSFCELNGFNLSELIEKLLTDTLNDKSSFNSSLQLDRYREVVSDVKHMLNRLK